MCMGTAHYGSMQHMGQPYIVGEARPASEKTPVLLAENGSPNIALHHRFLLLLHGLWECGDYTTGLAALRPRTVP